MKKSWIILLGMIISFIFVPFVFAEVRINEVLVNPDRCSNSDCEYIEIYTNSTINLTNWNINTANWIVKIMLDWARHTELAPDLYAKAHSSSRKHHSNKKEYIQKSLFSDITEEL